MSDWKLLTIITKRLILDVAAALDPPLRGPKSSHMIAKPRRSKPVSLLKKEFVHNCFR